MRTGIEPVARARWRGAGPWLGTLARLLLAGVWLVAGAAKVGDLAASARAVHAYQLTPYTVSELVGAALPFVELALAALLLLGLGTRAAASVSAGLLAVFVTGISSAWARGLTIDCGCFGGGGELAGSADPGYGLELARSGALALVAVALAVRPRTALAVDGYVLGAPTRAERT